MLHDVVKGIPCLENAIRFSGISNIYIYIYIYIEIKFYIIYIYVVYNYINAHKKNNSLLFANFLGTHKCYTAMGADNVYQFH